ncbi:hypothetical protein [Breoghania sp.]|uniref:hypothetical protein n=1 Tax=Breoghania sp. TaxID=2065378 RepID=UPI002AAB3043|nr:hypothetical protein [Breoghania sp.]
MENLPAEYQTQPKSAQPVVNGYGMRALFLAIQRANEAVTSETTALRQGVRVDLRDFERRKSQALLDLTRAGENLAEGPFGPEVAETLGMLRNNLKDNMQLLSTHLQAVREISEMISRSLIEADSDGTYTRDTGRGIA